MTIHEHRGTRAIRRMVEIAPATGGLALWIAHRDLAAGDEATRALVTTDGATIFYTPAFTDLPLARQIGHVAHAVLHVALLHNARYAQLARRLGEADLALFNVCADAIVNSALSHLDWMELPRGAITLDRLLSEILRIDQTTEAALLEWDVERLYRAINDREPRGAPLVGARRENVDAGRDRRAAHSNQTASSAHQTSAASTDDGPRAASARVIAARSGVDLLPLAEHFCNPENGADAMREWGERVRRAHAGDGEFSMLRVLLADVPRARTPWEQVLRTRLARGLTHKPEVSWSRPSRSWIANRGRAGGRRRMPWEPGRSQGGRAPRLAVMLDNSGSIDAGLLDRFAAELAAISRQTESGIVLIVGDDRVQRVVHLAAGTSVRDQMAVQGGGQTDFTPLLEAADKYRPDIGVFLTDLEGPARFRPRWPVVWAVPVDAGVSSAPFGRILFVD